MNEIPKDIELKMKKDRELMDEIKYILGPRNIKNFRSLDRIDFKKDGDGNFTEIKITFFPTNRDAAKVIR